MPLTTESAARKDNTTGANAELQHRHFAFIATTIKALKPDMNATQWRIMQENFENACACTNPRFDRRRFLAACGGQS